MRVILDNDFSADPDGLFQLAHHLASPTTEIPLVVGTHTHPNDFLDRSDTQADNAIGLAKAIIDRMRIARPPQMIAGRNGHVIDRGHEPSMAARAIVEEALRSDTDLPLVYAAGAGLGTLGEALRLAPDISRRMRLVWIGGRERNDLQPSAPINPSAEYNAMIDLDAVRHVFNESGIEIWQVPRNVYRTMLVSRSELEIGLAAAGELGRFLLSQLERAVAAGGMNLGETYILGDSPLVTLTALQSSFDADTSSSEYVIVPTPEIDGDGRYVSRAVSRPMRVYRSVEARLTFADMFAKLKAAHA